MTNGGYSADSAMRNVCSSLARSTPSVCDDINHVAEVAVRIHIVQFGRPDKVVQHRTLLTTMIRAEEQPVFPQTHQP